jgi:D-alanine-D-alanine ligase
MLGFFDRTAERRYPWNMSKSRVGVLVGGAGAEHQLSMRAGESVSAVLGGGGHDVETIFVDRDADLVLRQARIDVAFLALRGRYSGDGCLQGLLELRGIPYTGPGLLSSALASNRARLLDALRLNNLPTAAGYGIDVAATANVVEAHDQFGFPVWVHPVGAPPGLGVSLARDELELEAAVEQAARFSDRVSVERFVDGRVFQIATLHGRALGLLDVGAADRAPGGLDERTREAPGRARLTSVRQRSLLRLAELACEAIGAEGPALVEMVLSDRFNEVVRRLDVSPLLLPDALYPRMAEAAGLGYPELVGEVLASARLHAHGTRTDRRALDVRFEGPERRIGAPPSAH